MTKEYLFIEALDFTSAVRSYVESDEAYAELQAMLVEQPDKEGVIPGASPLRKLRWRDERRAVGKSGGMRLIYIHVPDLGVLFMLDVYGKHETDDLTIGEKKELQLLARQLIRELRERHKRGKL